MAEVRVVEDAGYELPGTDTVAGALVYECLRSRILHRELAAGTVVELDGLLAELDLGGLSRADLGTVVDRLRHERLLDPRPDDDADDAPGDAVPADVRVATLPPHEVSALFEVRIALERAVARGAAARRRDADVRALERAHRAMETSVASDPPSRVALSRTFTAVLRRATRNDVLVRAHEDVESRMGPIATPLAEDRFWWGACGTAGEILAAVRAGDVDVAGDVAERATAAARDHWAARHGAP